MASVSREYQNTYTHTTMRKNGSSVPALRIYCSTCTAHLDLPLTGPTCSQSFADRMFRNKQWEIGRARKFDRCPDCQAREAAEREERRAQAVAKPAPITIAYSREDDDQPVIDLPPTEVREVELTVVPERNMGREDKRIIFAKLNDVYRDENTGYAKGWSDEKVAHDLGVPVHWITTIREADFGPADPTGPLFSELRKLISDADDAFDKFSVAVDDAVRERNAFENRLSALEDRIKALEARK